MKKIIHPAAGFPPASARRQCSRLSIIKRLRPSFAPVLHQGPATVRYHPDRCQMSALRSRCTAYRSHYAERAACLRQRNTARLGAPTRAVEGFGKLIAQGTKLFGEVKDEDVQIATTPKDEIGDRTRSRFITTSHSPTARCAHPS
jgi:hypothetical protein